jgi:DNA-binding transcriptional MerR regulator
MTELATSGQPRLSIGEVAQRTGLSVHALRFYEREGLLASPVQRTADGHRAYRERDLTWLEVCKERLDILRQHQQRVTAQIVAFTTCLQMINFKVNLYQDSLTADPSDPIWSDIQDCLAYDN